MGSVPTEGIASLSVNNHKCINFLILGLSLYVLIRSDTPLAGLLIIVFELAGRDAIVKRTIDCEYCEKQVSEYPKPIFYLMRKESVALPALHQLATSFNLFKLRILIT